MKIAKTQNEMNKCIYSLISHDIDCIIHFSKSTNLFRSEYWYYESSNLGLLSLPFTFYFSDERDKNFLKIKYPEVFE